MYTQRIDRNHPACVIVLVDRSYSMSRPVTPGSSTTLAEAVSQVVNRTLFELVVRSIAGPTEGPRHYYDVGVIGYGMDPATDGPGVASAWGGALRGRGLVSVAELAEHPVRIDEWPVPGPTNDGGTVRTPVWVDPAAGYGTPMCGAVELAGAWIHEWVHRHPDSFPPIVVNITDGEVTDRGSDGAGLFEWTRRLRTLCTTDGPTLMFNVFVAPGDEHQVIFPTSAEELAWPEGRDLFEVSSVLPGPMASLAAEMGYPVRAGSRGLVFNADMSALANFLQIGTAVMPRLTGALAS